jgi:acyl-CoA-binding protein
MVGVVRWRRGRAAYNSRARTAGGRGIVWQKETERRQQVSDLKKKFDDAAAAVKKLKEDPGSDVKLQLYALYKQGAEGDVAGKRPGFTDMIGRAKFDAWTKVKGLSKDEAMKKYVELVKSLGG